MPPKLDILKIVGSSLEDLHAAVKVYDQAGHRERAAAFEDVKKIIAPTLSLGGAYKRLDAYYELFPRVNYCHGCGSELELGKGARGQSSRCYDCANADARRHRAAYKQKALAASNAERECEQCLRMLQPVRFASFSARLCIACRNANYKAANHHKAAYRKDKRERGIMNPRVAKTPMGKIVAREWRGQPVDLHDLTAIAGGVCWYCEEELSLLDPIECDHIEPLARGGKHRRHNVALIHKTCNAHKGNWDLLRGECGEALMIRAQMMLDKIAEYYRRAD